MKVTALSWCVLVRGGLMHGEYRVRGSNLDGGSHPHQPRFPNCAFSGTRNSSGSLSMKPAHMQAAERSVRNLNLTTNDVYVNNLVYKRAKELKIQ